VPYILPKKAPYLVKRALYLVKRTMHLPKRALYPVKRAYIVSKRTNKLQDTKLVQKQQRHMFAKTDLQKKPTKETYKRDLQKRPTQETYKKDQKTSQWRCKLPTYGWKRPRIEWNETNVCWKRPIKRGVPWGHSWRTRSFAAAPKKRPIRVKEAYQSVKREIHIRVKRDLYV